MMNLGHSRSLPCCIWANLTLQVLHGAEECKAVNRGQELISSHQIH